jgi:hypothetical protein
MTRNVGPCSGHSKGVEDDDIRVLESPVDELALATNALDS